MQSGLVVCAVGASLATGSWGWAFVGLVLSPVYIVLLMLSATTGAELAKQAKYGDDPAYQDYVERSGALLPRRG